MSALLGVSVKFQLAVGAVFTCSCSGGDAVCNIGSLEQCVSSGSVLQPMQRKPDFQHVHCVFLQYFSTLVAMRTYTKGLSLATVLRLTVTK